MHKISKILNQDNLSIEDISKIEGCWEEMIEKCFHLRNKKALYFYKGCKKHLTLNQIETIEIISQIPAIRFQKAIETIKACLIFTKKKELEKLVERKINGNNSERLGGAISILFVELKNEKNFLKELLSNTNDSKIQRLAFKSIPEEFANLAF